MGLKRSSHESSEKNNVMKYSTALAIFLVVLFEYRIANAVTNTGYGLIRESVFLTLALACLVISSMILRSLRGGSLGTPWLFFTSGFIVACLGSAIELFDIGGFLFSQYDLRQAILVTRIGSMLLLLLGLVFYKRGLE
jgi:hypothetical protein